MVVFQEGLQLQSQEELGVGWASGARGAIFALPKWPINQFKPVQKSRQKAIRAYCPTILLLLPLDFQIFRLHYGLDSDLVISYVICL